MFWLGMVLGFCVGTVLATFGYWRLTERFDEVVAKLRNRQELIDECITEIGRLTSENNKLRREQQ